MLNHVFVCATFTITNFCVWLKLKLIHRQYFEKLKISCNFYKSVATFVLTSTIKGKQLLKICRFFGGLEKQSSATESLIFLKKLKYKRKGPKMITNITVVHRNGICICIDVFNSPYCNK